MGNFYSRLSYSFGNEDWRTEQKALKIQPDDSVLCVTASGDRPLNLLSTELRELVSIDANPIQNALFDLKRAALKRLEYNDYISFLGVGEHPNRMTTYSALKPDLDPTSVKLWERHRKKIQKGVIYEGAMEKFLKIVSTGMRPFRGKKIDRLFAFDDLEQQRDYLHTTWKTYLWRKTFDIMLHPRITGIFFKDPGLYAYVDEKVHIGNQLYQKLHGYLERFLAKESVLLSLILKGEVDQSHFPPYLNESGLDRIRSQLDKVKFETIDMGSYLEKMPDNSIDCFSCSDIASYLSRKEFDRILRGIQRTAKPGARFCMRQFLSDHHISEDLAPYFERDSALEKELEGEDRCFVYRFTCGIIKK